MKKLFLLICIVSVQYAFANSEVPDIPISGSYNIEYTLIDNGSSINSDKMKSSEKIEEAKNKALNNSKPKFYFDKKQINEQRALDYMNHQNNALLPSF